MGLLNRVIALVILVIVAVIAIAYLFSANGPFRTQTNTPAPPPVTIGQIQKLYKLQTAQVTGQSLVQGETKSGLPFSTATITYQVVLTMTAGIDLSTLKDGDIQSNGDILTINLPDPQVLSEEVDFTPIAESKEILSGPSERKDLPKQVVDAGKKKVRDGILQQGKLMSDARLNAEDEIRNLVFQIAPQYKKVIFGKPAAVSPSVAPNPSGPPK